MDTYEKKLALAKEALDSGSYDKETIEYIFPELSESEDERIRKELIDIVAKSPITFAFEDKGKVLAWLEKQGEHANFRNKIQIGDKVTRNEDGVLVNLSQLKRVAKPADKVEPIVIRDFNSVFSREQVEEIDKRIEESQRLYIAKLRDAMRKVEDFPMTD